MLFGETTRRPVQMAASFTGVNKTCLNRLNPCRMGRVAITKRQRGAAQSQVEEHAVNYEITQELAKSGHQLVMLLGTQNGMYEAASLVQRMAAQLDILGAVLNEKTKLCEALVVENSYLLPETASELSQGIRNALDACSDYLDTDCVMDRLSISYEEAELRTAGAYELHVALEALANSLSECGAA